MEKKLNSLMLTAVVLSFLNSDLWAQTIKLPKDPGYQSDQTLLGIDSNSNNVRDDVEIFIYENLSKVPEKYMAYLKYAETKIEFFKSRDNLDKLHELDSRIGKDTSCLSVVDKNNFTENTRKLDDKIVNTEQRKKVVKDISKKYNEFAAPLKGYLESEKRSLCRF